MNGWNEDKVYDALNVMDDIYNVAYELKHCVRGCHTGAYTYQELSNVICRLAERLQQTGENLAYEQEDVEDDED